MDALDVFILVYLIGCLITGLVILIEAYNFPNTRAHDWWWTGYVMI